FHNGVHPTPARARSTPAVSRDRTSVDDRTRSRAFNRFPRRSILRRHEKQHLLAATVGGELAGVSDGASESRACLVVYRFTRHAGRLGWAWWFLPGRHRRFGSVHAPIPFEPAPIGRYGSTGEARLNCVALRPRNLGQPLDEGWRSIARKSRQVVRVEFPAARDPIDVAIDDPRLEVPEDEQGECAEGNLGDSPAERHGDRSTPDLPGQ